MLRLALLMLLSFFISQKAHADSIADITAAYTPIIKQAVTGDLGGLSAALPEQFVINFNDGTELVGISETLDNLRSRAIARLNQVDYRFDSLIINKVTQVQDNLVILGKAKLLRLAKNGGGSQLEIAFTATLHNNAPIFSLIALTLHIPSRITLAAPPAAIHPNNAIPPNDDSPTLVLGKAEWLMLGYLLGCLTIATCFILRTRKNTP